MHKTITKTALILILICWNIAPAFAGKIAIVIDDIGNQASDKQLLSLNENLTYAVLPHTPFGFSFSQDATKQQRDILIHLPMQANNKNSLLGPGALTNNMSKSEYQKTLIAAIESIPYAVGINNHMGSLLTQLDQPMRWTMELLQQHNLFFLDSKTTEHSKVEAIADQYGVDALHRNIFLDHVRQPRVIGLQFKRLIELAKKHGYAIAIGHPYPETVAFLRDNLPLLKEIGVELVPLSKLMPTSLTLPNNNLDLVNATTEKSNPKSE